MGTGHQPRKALGTNRECSQDCRIVIGDINGQFEAVFQKLAALHAKQNFSLAIVAGSLFQDPELATNEDVEAINRLLEGKVKVPLSTYFALGKHSLPEKVTFKLDANAGELCPNLFFLGRKTVTKTSDGIKIVSLCGVAETPHESAIPNEYRASYTEEEAKSLENTKTADILITSEWPDGIRKGSKVDFAPDQKLTYSKSITELCVALKPKYHFSTSPSHFYEREPFFHSSQEASDTFSITRYLSLAAFNNPKKSKWIYAFSLDPTAAGPLSLPAGTTTSPLSSSTKRAPLPDQNTYRYSNDTNYADSRPHKRRKHKRAPPPGPAECFFCLSNPNVATQLITSIGNDSYVTIAKGPLTTKSTYPDLEFPAHMLLIPLVHTPTLHLIADEAARSATEKEMQLYRSALNSMLKQKAPTLGSVTWEVSRAAGIHVHWQWLPISSDLIHRGLVHAAFKIEAENQKLAKFENNPAHQYAEDDYFKVLIWDPATKKDTVMILPLDASVRFDLQFGRRVLAKLLELDSRADWKECGQASEEEEQDANRFKETFKEFDFSLED